jgi:fumarate hydratase class II
VTRTQAYIENSLALVTALVPTLGYDRAAKLSHQAYEQNKSIRQVVREQNLLSEAQLDDLLGPKVA